MEYSIETQSSLFKYLEQCLVHLQYNISSVTGKLYNNTGFNLVSYFYTELTSQYSAARTFAPLLGHLEVFADISAFVAESHLSVFQQVKWNSVLYRQIHAWCFISNGFQAGTHFSALLRKLSEQDIIEQSNDFKLEHILNEFQNYQFKNLK
ncbi:Hypothetical_protein [Hexamita inflata]|uniref:Hypothetical_protein n=1 Tax=Hexamita inflata TaxID=28002 RepID=A0AA86P416_9EUKA|nr:Hypothetical protein HINF_LOCUS19189 [Hexamita inflata]